MVRPCGFLHSVVLALGVMVVLLPVCFSAVTVEAATLSNSVGYTVSGVAGNVGSSNGFPGVSELQNPSAICASLVSTTTGEKGHLLIGVKNAFRTFSRQNFYTGYWFGKSPSSGIPTTGSISEVSLINPYGCVSISDSNATYFVQNNAFVYTVISQSTLYAFKTPCPSTGCSSLVDIAIYNNAIYVVSQRQELFKCSISSSDYTISACTQIKLTNINLSNGGGGRVGVAVRSDGIFLATGAALHWYNLITYAFIASSSVAAVDVHEMLQVSGTLIAATKTGLYNVTASGTSLTATLLQGSSSTTSQVCSAAVDYDGENPTFCNINRVYPISFAEIYLTNQDLGTLRLLSYPTVKVPMTLPIAFPIGMTNSEEDLEKIWDELDDAVRKAIQEKYPNVDTDNIYVNRTTPTVDNVFNTTVIIEIPQNDYDSGMNDTINGTDLNSTLNLVNTYYSGVDEYVYTDSILLDMCNETSKLAIMLRTANVTREALTYPLIYTTTPALANTNSSSVYTVFLKLLMPKVFGTIDGTTNTTTTPLIEAVDYSAALLNALEKSYAASQQGLLRFPEQTYHISQYGTEKQQQIRLYLQEVVTKRFQTCSGEGTSVNMNPTGTCSHQVGLSNRTMVQGDLTGTSAAQFNVFVPDVYTSNFDVQECLDATDWSGFEDWLKGLHHTQSKCGTGCIIGIAVGAAVVLVALIVLLIVCISKRRRLAVVVAPPPPTKPGFVSALDLDSITEEEDDLRIQLDNPLG